MSGKILPYLTKDPVPGGARRHSPIHQPLTVCARALPSVEDLCGDCKAKTQPPVPWESLIKRNNRPAAASL